MATIADKLTTIAGIKTDIRTAINNKGGSLTSGSPFSAYSAAISSLPSGGGGGASSTDWSQIGYTGAPQTVQDAFSYARTIYVNWDPTVTNLENKFNDNKNLVYAPLVDTSRATNMQGMFQSCINLSYLPLLITSNVTNMSHMLHDASGLTSASIPLFDTSSVTDMSHMFENDQLLTTLPPFNTSACTNMNGMVRLCSGLVSIPQLDTSKVTDMGSMFDDCEGLTSVPQFDTSSVTDMEDMFNGCRNLTVIPALDSRQVTNMMGMFSGCHSLKKITSLDMDKCTRFDRMFSFGMDNLRFMLLKGLGTPSGVTSYEDTNMSECSNWGVADDTYTDARQSLVDSLLTYSFDRAAAGYATCEIKLSSDSYDQLTAQELADIQAKGYTITT